ncbi:MAG: response regulator [Gemmataceae bacterium]
MIPSVSLSDPVGIRPAAAPPGILVVDDDAALRTVLGRELRKRGFAVWLAAGGREAVGLYTLLSDFIDLVLMDVNMPDLSGPAAFAELRSVTPDVRCCFMTADHRPETVAALVTDGALGVYHKPFASLTALCQSLRQHARPGETSDSNSREVVQWTS